MSTLITGATGYIGAHLTQTLIDQGEKIRVLCRTKPELPLFNHPAIDVFYGDINDIKSLQKAMHGISKLYHLAAYARLWAKDPTHFYRINVEGTKNVFESALEANIKKIVYASTAGVIGPSDLVPMNENSPRIVPFFNAYEETKTEAEKVAQEYVTKGLNISIVNPARVYGPGLDSGSNPVTKIIELYLKGKWRVIPGTGEDIGSYCYIEDVVNGHISAMEKGTIGERYIFGGINARFKDFINIVKDLSGEQYKMFHIPFPILEASSQVMKLWSRLSGRPPLITPDWVKRYNYNWALNSNKAVLQLGYTIRPLQEGIKKTIDWLRNNRL